VKKSFFFALLLLCSLNAAASWSVTISDPSWFGVCRTVTATGNSCAAVKSAYTACFTAANYTGASVTACSADPVVAGSTVTFHNSSSDSIWSLLSVTGSTVCGTGFHLDAAGTNCVADTVAGTGDAATIAALQAALSALQSSIATTNSNVTNAQAGVQTLLNAAAVPFDQAYAWAAFSFFFGSVIFFYTFGKSIGLVMTKIRNKRDFG
jgi:hypothetical protein